jgi:hypothetical protein
LLERRTDLLLVLLLPPPTLVLALSMLLPECPSACVLVCPIVLLPLWTVLALVLALALPTKCVSPG